MTGAKLISIFAVVLLEKNAFRHPWETADEGTSCNVRTIKRLAQAISLVFCLINTDLRTWSLLLDGWCDKGSVACGILSDLGGCASTSAHTSLLRRTTVKTRPPLDIYYTISVMGNQGLGRVKEEQRPVRLRDLPPENHTTPSERIE